MKIYCLSLALAGLFCFSSCSDFLEEYDPNKIPASTYYQTEDDIRMAANGAYAALRGNGYYKNMYLYTDVRSENTTLQDPGAGGGINYQFFNYTLSTDNSQVKTHWADLYKCVTRSNIILDQIDGISFADDTEKQKLKAEMYFLRALTYYHLVMQFGDVPLVTKELKTKEEIQEHTARDPKSKVYDLIIDDLTKVTESPLPDNQTGDGIGRASKAAAYGLLGKVYLSKAADEDFQAEREANLKSAKSNLEAVWKMRPFGTLNEISYADVFDKDAQEKCTEIIFRVMYEGGNSSLASNYAYIFQPTSQTGLTSQKSGTGNNIPTEDMMNAYEPGDMRKDISCGTSSSVNYVKKYTDLDDVNGYGDNDWIILRYADIALMLAEVKMHLNETDAVNYLNMVRERAGLPDYTGSNLRDAILQERRVELAFEGQSWYDLLRLYSHQELLSVMQKKNPNFSEKDFLLPIPYDEHKLDPERMYQNKGYN